MFLYREAARACICVICSLFLLMLMTGVAVAMDPRFELAPQLVQGKDSVTKPTKKAEPKPKKRIHRPKMMVKAPLQGQTFQLLAPAQQPVTMQSGIPSGLRTAWDRLVKSPAGSVRQLSFQSDTFSLSIDPTRYPLLPAQDGGVILLDSQGTLPALVRTLIQEKDRSVRVVSTPPGDQRRFMAELLSAGGFYSIEEQFMMEFGADPRLTVRSDFKVERAADSLLRQDIVLMNAGSQGSSPRVADFLRQEGMTLVEPFATELPTPAVPRHQLYRFSGRGQADTVDALLSALAIPFEKNRRVELFSAAESGIALSVQADRSFERNGKRYIVTRFSGDPVAYTLLRLLETKGYRVVILEGRDDFRGVADKLLSRMDMSAAYASHLLVNHSAGRYSLEMSAFVLENSLPDGGALVLTDRPLDRVMRELLMDHGYQLQER